MNKKAQGLTITTVVVAVLAILVLVVLFYIFTTKTGGLSKQLSVCPGACVTKAECTTNLGGVPIPGKHLVDYASTTVCEDQLPQGNYVCCSVSAA